MKKNLLLLLALLLIISVQLFPTDDIWTSTGNWGKYNVGFISFHLQDHGRSYNISKDGLNTINAARPVTIFLWYPTNSKDPDNRMTIMKYIEKETLPNDSISINKKIFLNQRIIRELSDDTKKSLLNNHTMGYLNAEIINKKLPLLLLIPGYNYESPIILSHIGELMASRGYLVASIKLRGINSPRLDLQPNTLETITHDVEYAIDYIHRKYKIDSKNTGVIGFDLGGMIGSLLCMKNESISLMISLDAGIMFDHNIKQMEQSPFYKPEKIKIPIIHFISSKEQYKKYGIIEDYRLLNKTNSPGVMIIRFNSIFHPGFTTYNILENSYKKSSVYTSITNYQTLLRYIQMFLSNKNSSLNINALENIEKTPEIKEIKILRPSGNLSNIQKCREND